MNEWLKVMLGEVARKKAEHAAALEEQALRNADQTGEAGGRDDSERNADSKS